MSLNGTCPQCKGDLQVNGDGWIVMLTVPVPVANRIIIDSVELLVVQGSGAQELPVIFDSRTSTTTGNKRTIQWTASMTYVPASARLRFTFLPEEDDEDEGNEDFILDIVP